MPRKATIQLRPDAAGTHRGRGTSQPHARCDGALKERLNATQDTEAAALVLRPLLRYVDEAAATIWVETSRSCQVEVLGHRARTFEVAGHHYGLVVITGPQPGTEYPYEVVLDETVRWPGPDPVFGPAVLRTLDPGRPRRLMFGSSRRESWPDSMLLIGDQVCPDATGMATQRFIEGITGAYVSYRIYQHLGNLATWPRMPCGARYSSQTTPPRCVSCPGARTRRRAASRGASGVTSGGCGSW